MSIKIKFYGKISYGKFRLNDPDLYQTHLSKFKEGQEMEMTIDRKHKRRTQGAPGEETNFNGYLWGVVYKIIGDEIGEMDLDYIHYWAQINTGNVKIAPDGKTIPKGTSWMSGGEFAEYCSKVRIWAAKPGNIVEKGIYIPDPNECDWE